MIFAENDRLRDLMAMVARELNTFDAVEAMERHVHKLSSADNEIAEQIVRVRVEFETLKDILARKTKSRPVDATPKSE